MGLQHMPHRKFLLQMPFGKEKHRLLELQEVARGGNAPAEHTTRAEAVAPWQQRDTALPGILGSSLHPCPGPQKPQSRATSPGAKHGRSLQEWHFPGLPPQLLERSAYFCVGWGEAPEAVGGE